MRLLFYLAGLIALLMLGGCSYPRSDIGFWDQHVYVTAWGFTWATPYGPINLGYINWERNIANPIPAANPIVPPVATIP